jgi:hypothetical protein
MPFIKPIELLRLQIAAQDAVDNGCTPPRTHGGALKNQIRMCPVCGEESCGQEVFKINDYLFHAEDIENRKRVKGPRDS